MNRHTSLRGVCPWLVLGLLGLALILPLFIPGSANRIDLDTMLAAPSRSHLLGTDENGRDVLARLLEGARITLGVGLAGAAISVGIGVVLGSIAALRGGVVDALVMRLVDFVMAVPSLFVILVLTSLVPSNVISLALVIGLTGWMPVARLVRGQVRTILREPFVEAAVSTGAGSGWIIARHLLPNARQVIGIAALVQLSRAILAEATVSFLGLGVQPPTPTWGNMLIGAQDFLFAAPWLAIAPGVAITGTLLLVASLQSSFANDGNRPSPRR